MRIILWIAVVAIILDYGTAKAEELAKEVREILKNRCYSCHGESGANEGGFNYSLNRKRLVRELVVPGAVEESRLFERVNKGEMPPDGDRLSKEEIGKLQAWIEQGTPSFATEVERGFITPLDMHTAMRDDLEKAAERDRPFLRYFTLTHLYNAGFEDNELESHRRGLSKLLNSLSWGREVRVPVPVDSNKTVLRIDLRHYKWNETEGWNHVVSADPYRVDYDDDIAKSCSSYTNCKQPHVRVDWFVFAASRPPLYNVILGLPETAEQFVKFEKERLGVDVARNLKDYSNVLRAGFYPSGVSKSNRLIERHESSYGAYWKSYDFKPVDSRKGKTRRSNLKANPIGPDDDQGFEHDGGEMIFNLPNGLQGYMLTDAAGNQIPKGPTDVVVDKEAVSRGRDPEVINGVSCMNCHWSGMLKKSDQIRDHVLKQPTAYAPRIVEFVKAVYSERKELDAMFQQDRERFETAVKKCGLPALAKTEPVATLAFQFDEPLDFELAAAEAGVAPAVLEETLKNSPALGRQLGSLPHGQAVPRETYVANFRSLIQQLKRSNGAMSDEFRDLLRAENLWYGKGVKIDRIAAADLYLQLAKLQNPIAMGEAATLYNAGHYVSKNLKEAERLAKACLEPLSQLAEGVGLESSLAQVVLGDLYGQGIGVEKDIALASQWYRKAADSQNPSGALGVAILLSAEGNYKEAMQWCLKAANQELPDAQLSLGILYFDGAGVKQDFNEAASWMKKAADQGSPEGLARLGNMYLRGQGVDKNVDEAFRLAVSSADQKDPMGQHLLGAIYLLGQGAPLDLTKARTYFRRSAGQGFASAQFDLAIMYAEGKGIAKNPTQAFEWFQKAANQNFPPAEEQVALCYRNGLGCPVDKAEAARWMEKAAEEGIASAQNSVGDMYYSGIGVKQDHRQAFKWFELAAKQQLPIAEFNLGHMYSLGFGVPENPSEAITWFRKAVKSNIPEAQHSLAICFLRGDGVTQDYTEAFRLLSKATDQKFLPAIIKLAEMHEKGLGIPKDISKAVKLLAQAAELGDLKVQKQLGDMNREGKGIAINYAEALKWYKLAAAQNDFDSNFALVSMNMKGQGAPRNLAEARTWLSKANEFVSSDNPPTVLLDARRKLLTETLETIKFLEHQ